MSREIEVLSLYVAREIEVLSVRVTGEIEVFSLHVTREIEVLSVRVTGEIEVLSEHVAREIEVLSVPRFVPYCNNNNNTNSVTVLITLQRSKQCYQLATSRPCLSVCMVMKVWCRGGVEGSVQGGAEGWRRFEGWRRLDLSTSGSSGPFCAALPNVIGRHVNIGVRLAILLI